MKKLLILSLFIFSGEIYSQACCTAGAPLLGSLDMSITNRGAWRFGLTYEYNSLQSVYSGTLELEDDSRNRLTHAALFEVNYGLTNRITLTALFSFINQIRSINSAGASSNRLSLSGFGDVLLLAKYSIINTGIAAQRELAVGAGLKAPIGASDLKSGGVLLPADMQPGTGSWDGILWGYFNQGFLPAFPLNVVANLTYRFNGTNKRFGANSQGYKFGNELISSAGLGCRTDLPIDITLFLRYRFTEPDEFADGEIPNTGGSWLSLVPGLNIKIFDSFTTRISGQIPVYRDLQGTQLSTTHTLSVSFFYSINSDQSLINF